MMPEVADIICDEEFESDGRIVTDEARVCQFLVRDVRNDVDQMQIVKLPEVNECAPRLSLIPLSPDPGFLVVCRQSDFRSKLTANKSLVVIARRVDKMAQDLSL